jgi:hypothetical protein
MHSRHIGRRSFLLQTPPSLRNCYITEVPAYVGTEDGYEQVCTGEARGWIWSSVYRRGKRMDMIKSVQERQEDGYDQECTGEARGWIWSSVYRRGQLKSRHYYSGTWSATTYPAPSMSPVLLPISILPSLSFPPPQLLHFSKISIFFCRRLQNARVWKCVTYNCVSRGMSVHEYVLN